MEYPEETIEINVGGTANLLKACKTHGVTRFVMASSAAVYGSSDSFPLEEKHAGASHSPYADSKWQNELQVLEAKKEGMQAIALRLFNVYGTGQRHQGAYAAVVPKFIDAALKGQPVTVFGDGLQTRDFIHVNDVAQALLMLATEPWRKELEHVYNVCTQTEISHSKHTGRCRTLHPAASSKSYNKTQGRYRSIRWVKCSICSRHSMDS